MSESARRDPPSTDPAGMNEARMFVEEHAWIKRPYGGGCQALVYLQGRIIDATDAWQGEDYARERLAERVYRTVDGDADRMTVERYLDPDAPKAPLIEPK